MENRQPSTIDRVLAEIAGEDVADGVEVGGAMVGDDALLGCPLVTEGVSSAQSRHIRRPGRRGHKTCIARAPPGSIRVR